MAAAHAHQAGFAERDRHRRGLVRVHAKPIGDAVDRGPAQDLAACLLEEGTAKAAGTIGNFPGYQG
jgi:hypothetical protein